jgi:hypothetical protein
MYNHCQNPKCHHNPTTDRVRGPKGNKVYVTRNSTNYFGIACTYRCLYEYWTHNKEAIARAIPERPKQSRPYGTYLNDNNEWVDC